LHKERCGKTEPIVGGGHNVRRKDLGSCRSLKGRGIDRDRSWDVSRLGGSRRRAMALPSCQECGSYDLDLVRDLDDGRKQLKCVDCGHEWVRGEERVLVDAVTRAAPAKRY
jgi:hypothetical protein